MHEAQSDFDRAALRPVAIGGVGGSGTRLIAEILRHLGYYMGGDLNRAADNLWFTLLFKRMELWPPNHESHSFDRAVEVFRAVMVDRAPLTCSQAVWVQGLASEGRLQHDAKWLRARVDSLLRAAGVPGTQRWRGRFRERAGRLFRKKSPRPWWGWKEPNTHVFLDRLGAAFPEMKYVHVMRNGLDMAHSSNQNQLRLWGPAFLGSNEYTVHPRWSLKYWCAVHRRVIALGQSMPGRFLLLNYDDYCLAPSRGLELVLAFLGRTIDARSLRRLERLVRPPNSVGRFKEFGVDIFDPEDVAYVKSLGFDTRCD
jgi:sulfotransferase family protein